MKPNIRKLCVFAIVFLVFSMPIYHISSCISEIAQTELILTVQTDKPDYSRGELVKIVGSVQDSGGTPIVSAIVSIEVKDPGNNTIFLDIIFTTSSGTYQDSFRLHSEAMRGKYHVYVTASVLGYPTAKNQTTFTVEMPTIPVGGIWIPVNKLELLAPYIALTILLAVAVTTVVYVKKRKKHTEINS